MLIAIFFFFPQLKYKEDYNKNVKGQWCETPYFDVATARVAMENLSDVRTYYYIRSSIFRVVLVCYLSVSNCCSFLFAEKIHTRLRGNKRPN